MKIILLISSVLTVQKLCKSKTRVKQTCKTLSNAFLKEGSYVFHC